MCASVYFKDSRKHITTVAGLARHLHVRPADLVWSQGFTERKPGETFEHCLCPIDVGATVGRFGYRLEPGDGDPMGHIANPIGKKR